jgi:hypothetical protein
MTVSKSLLFFENGYCCECLAIAGPFRGQSHHLAVRPNHRSDGAMVLQLNLQALRKRGALIGTGMWKTLAFLIVFIVLLALLAKGLRGLEMKPEATFPSRFVPRITGSVPRGDRQ